MQTTIIPTGEVAIAVGRNMRGDLYAETVMPLGYARRELRIRTDKCARGLSADATVVQVSEDGRSHTHAFSLSRFGQGDYSKQLRLDQKARATEKAIRTMHADALRDVGAVLDEAHAHYAARARAGAEA